MLHGLVYSGCGCDFDETFSFSFPCVLLAPFQFFALRAWFCCSVVFNKLLMSNPVRYVVIQDGNITDYSI